ncbi:MAG: hypothetical protein PHE88_03750 [Elusimicrobia bacterium]|nr:hypothetical protein [Elusimicrobiota bacterium]
MKKLVLIMLFASIVLAACKAKPAETPAETPAAAPAAAPASK